MLTAIVFTAGSAVGLAAGPDVVVSDLPETQLWGFSGDTAAYSLGTTSCNRGDQPATWVHDTNQHPVIAQNLYRLAGGRFEQIGMSWLKHGFFAVAGDECGTCVPPLVVGQELGVGCSDPYSAGFNGTQGQLGPRSEVNPFTGEFPYPFTVPSGDATLAGRLQVAVNDVDPAVNGGAVYVIEAQYVSPDDAAAGNGGNNASYRPARFNGSLQLVPEGAVVETLPAIFAWRDLDPGVELTWVQVPADGLMVVGARATDNDDGSWHYEYAVFNMTSHRAAGSFTVPWPPGTTVTALGFADIEAHSGEAHSGDDWLASVSATGVTWSTVSHASDPDANALTWGTLYNFWFDAEAAPAPALATIGLFRPAAPSTVAVTTIGPGGELLFASDFERGERSDWSTELRTMGLQSSPQAVR